MATRVFLAAVSLAASFSGVLAEDLEWCGDAQYYPAEYTCFDDSTLCPILFGLPNRPCGGGCYAPEMYQCESGSLSLLPEEDGPFKLTTHSTVTKVSGWELKACGNYLAIGAGARECNSCPEGAACDEYQNETVFLPNGEMAADLPGGQYWYVSPEDGALMFTEGGDEAEAGIALAGQRVEVYSDGFFSYQGSRHYWLACLRRLPGGTVGTTRSYRIHAPTPENLEKEDCSQIKLVASSVADRKHGAYKYD
ncbi:uncharacterized protein DNG_08177 [Cephalotrichum gorgonifer]|uniref:Endo-1,3(4)-beta-glucanase 1 carbohydrate binding domain-containing protein n=1 Tax=Cephalotrichum gorgonifer TaxID=2041049 RepID=A0AAE8SY38_9PEZI|nr:uncharacterized protein DNG_08177 [Cephalotrichum gorgonifer]